MAGKEGPISVVSTEILSNPGGRAWAVEQGIQMLWDMVQVIESL